MMLHLSDDLGLFQSKIPSGEAEEVSFSEQGAARQPLLLDSHRWQGIFQNDYTDFAIGMTAAVAMQSEKKNLHYVIMEKVSNLIYLRLAKWRSN